MHRLFHHVRHARGLRLLAMLACVLVVIGSFGSVVQVAPLSMHAPMVSMQMHAHVGCCHGDPASGHCTTPGQDCCASVAFSASLTGPAATLQLAYVAAEQLQLGRQVADTPRVATSPPLRPPSA